MPQGRQQVCLSELGRWILLRKNLKSRMIFFTHQVISLDVKAGTLLVLAFHDFRAFLAWGALPCSEVLGRSFTFFARALLSWLEVLCSVDVLGLLKVLNWLTWGALHSLEARSTQIAVITQPNVTPCLVSFVKLKLSNTMCWVRIRRVYIHYL